MGIDLCWLDSSFLELQKIYFSCDIGFFDSDKRILDEMGRLALLLAYWRITDTKVFDTLLNYGFYPWFFIGFYWEIFERPKETKGTDWKVPYWDASPLLVLTDEWYYDIWKANYKHPDYFDRIMFWIAPEAGDIDIEIKEIMIWLNGKRILFYKPLEPLYFNRDFPLDLSEHIENCRSLYVRAPQTYMAGCFLPAPFPPQTTELLSKAAQDYGQGWDCRYGSHWCKECEENPDGAVWPTLPDTWCSEYTCCMMSKHTSFTPKCTDYFKDPRQIGVENMWDYFGDPEANAV